MNIIAELLLSYIDLTAVAIEAFDPYKRYSKPLGDYKKWRHSSHISSREFSHLKTGKYLVKIDNEYAITAKASRSITRYMVSQLKIPSPDRWDYIWRVIIFDIPEEKKSIRNIFRGHLKRLGLEIIQKSVFCYPYDCIREITFLTKVYRIEKYITYMEVSNIITDKDIFSIYFKNNIQ